MKHAQLDWIGPLPLVSLLLLAGVGSGNCGPDLGSLEFLCNPELPDPCPEGWACLARGPIHLCHRGPKGECGNGDLEAGEECDGESFGGFDCADYGRQDPEGTPLCTSDCFMQCTSCGNDILEPAGGEECDDGNRADGDGCSSQCQREVCGDGVLAAGEACDDGNNASGDGCSGDCQSTEFCGNGYTDTALGEECDDGNWKNRDGCNSQCSLEFPMWRSWTSPLDGGRSFHAMAHHAGLDLVVLFGGSSPAGLQNDTWLFGGNTWVAAPAGEAPGPRMYHAMAYDSQREQVVLFGGYQVEGLASNFVGDTWEFSGSAWVDISGEVSPGARCGAALTYLPARGCTLLFGGYDPDWTALGDTWLYCGQTWQNLNLTPGSSPPPRGFASIAYDPVGSRAVLVGGGDWTGNLADTWFFDGYAWDEASLASPPPAVHTASLAFDELAAVLILFGGNSLTEQRALGGTWIFDGSGWTESQHALAPSPRYGAGMVYRSSQQQMHLFGGTDRTEVFSDQWIMTDEQWSRAQNILYPPGQNYAGMAFDSTRGVSVLFGDATFGTWEFNGLQWEQRDLPILPPTRKYPAMAYDQAHARVVVFGGLCQSGDICGGTWLYDGDAWVELPTVPSPPPSIGPCMAYDSDNEEIVLKTANETWVLRDQTWLLLSPEGGFGSEGYGRMAYDKRRKRMVYFGGDWQAPTLSTWELVDDEWVDQPVVESPSPRILHVMFFDEGRERIILHGGMGADRTLVDTWEYVASDQGATWQILSTPMSAVTVGRGAHAYDSWRRVAVSFGGLPDIYQTSEFNFVSGLPDEICNNGMDDDGDALIDCEDEDCSSSRFC